MNSVYGPAVSLDFPLSVEDDWPPVAVETLPFEVVADGYRALLSPLFVKDLSVDDVIALKIGGGNIVESWKHVHRSRRTTMWILRLKQTNQITSTLAQLRNLGCNSVGFDAGGVYAVDIPESVSIKDVDSVTDSLDSDAVAVAFPSMRHPE